MRLVFVEVEGNNESILEGIKTLTAALHRSQPAAVDPQRIAAPGQKRNGGAAETATKQPASGVSGDQADAGEPESADQASAAEVSQDESPREPRSRGDRARRDANGTLRLVPDLNLHPAGKESLKEFAARHSIKNQQEQIAVIVYYLKQVLGLDHATSDHVFTCFRAVDWSIPLNLPQTIRNVKARTAWIGGERDNLAITTAGLNFVEREVRETSVNSQ